MEGMHFWQVTTTVAERQDADALALGAVGARFAACAQVCGPISSTYWWGGEVSSSQEWMVVLKTTSTRYPALEGYLRTAHPYQVPEIIAVPVVAGNPDYLAWLRTEIDAAQA